MHENWTRWKWFSDVSVDCVIVIELGISLTIKYDFLFGHWLFHNTGHQASTVCLCVDTPIASLMIDPTLLLRETKAHFSDSFSICSPMKALKVLPTHQYGLRPKRYSKFPIICIWYVLSVHTYLYKVHNFSLLYAQELSFSTSTNLLMFFLLKHRFQNPF